VLIHRLLVFGVASGVALVWHSATGLAGQELVTGSIVGRVDVTSSPVRRLATPGSYPGRRVGIQSDRETSELDNVIVFAEVQGTVDVPRQHVTIRQVGEEFVPHVVAVTVGSTVDFPNDDLIFHNVFSLSRASTFDLGRYPRGASKSRTFTRPGIVKVFCHLHSHMSAIVRVFSHPFFVIPERDGRFAIEGIPIGRYTVRAWHERVGEVTGQAHVTGTSPAELNLSLPLTESD
jgi:plastocyanin